MRTRVRSALLFVAVISALAPVVAQRKEPTIEDARRLAHRILIADTHIDLPYRLESGWEDVSGRTPDGEFDYVRAREGGLRLPFMSIYTPASLEGTGKSKPLADSLIHIVRRIASTWPDKFVVVTSPADVLRYAHSDRILLAMGMENGSPVEGDLRNLQYFYNEGIRYITLAHGKSNHICDSSYDPDRQWNGLSPFGKLVVTEMNRLGIMIDVAHVSDSTFYQVIRLSKAPIIASHSSCRYFTPGFERNMSDEMIRVLAAHGGVIQINFGSQFVDDTCRVVMERDQKEIREHIVKYKMNPDDSTAHAYVREYWREHPVAMPGVAVVAEHIDHVRKLVGIDYVGLGSDFDGLDGVLPVGLTDVSHYPDLILELMKLGYSERDIAKVCSGNILRVWSAVERVAQKEAKR